jgi:hypothetical protein
LSRDLVLSTAIESWSATKINSLSFLILLLYVCITQQSIDRALRVQRKVNYDG